MKIETNAVYTYKDIEKILGLSRRSLGEYIDKKELRPIVFGNKYRFLGSEILRFVERKMNQK